MRGGLSEELLAIPCWSIGRLVIDVTAGGALKELWRRRLVTGSGGEAVVAG